jgi:hypothetical protein
MSWEEYLISASFGTPTDANECDFKYFCLEVKEDNLGDQRALVIDPVGHLLHVHVVVVKFIPLSCIFTMKQPPLLTYDRTHASILADNELYAPH